MLKSRVYNYNAVNSAAREIWVYLQGLTELKIHYLLHTMYHTQRSLAVSEKSN